MGEIEKKQLLDAVKSDAKRFSASKKSAEAILKEAGILTEKGNFTKPYRMLDAAKAGSNEQEATIRLRPRCLSGRRRTL